MSTVVHNAFRLKDRPLGELNRLITAFRAQAMPVVDTLRGRFLANVAVGILDRQAMGLGETDAKLAAVTQPLGHAGDLLEERQRKARDTGRFDPAVDFQFEMSLIPVEGWILGRMHSAQKDLCSLWMRVSGAHEFWFDNRADRPASVTKAEWGERERLWDLAVPSGPISRHALSMALLDDYLVPLPPGAVTTYQPTLKTRIGLVADSIWRDRSVAAAVAQMDAAVPPDQRPLTDRAWEILDLARKLRATDEYQVLKNSLAAQAAARLKPRYCTADLLGFETQEHRFSPRRDSVSSPPSPATENEQPSP